MSTRIGHFEVLSELSKSATATVYKANDPQTSQTVALKAIQLSAFGDYAAEVEQSLIAEAEATKVLCHSNLSPIFGAGKIDGQFCAAMQYIQGNSIATMLANKEGFSIWDLLDIGRQVCSGFDHANSHKIFHFSLEPSKIMCGWDGGVRVLGYGISSLGKFAAQMPGVPSILHYMSPEQLRGEAIDGRSNLFSLGAIFYEMVTDQKAFAAEDAESLRQIIAESTPVPPLELNAKIHPGLSDLIMKALDKDPGQRYQSGRELLDDLEKCKESKPQAVKQAPTAASTVEVPESVKAAVQAKFIGSPASPPRPAAPPKPAASAPAPPAKPAAPAPVPPASRPDAAPMPPRPASAPPRAAATEPNAAPAQSRPPQTQPGASKIPAPATASAKAAAAPGSASGQQAPSAPVVNQPAAHARTPQVSQPQARAPKIAVDPLMAEDGPTQGSGVSFSEMTELPPLKEVYIEPPPPAEEPEAAPPSVTVFRSEPEKPKLQPREIAEKAVNEIKNVPPRLLMYSIGVAALVILSIAIGLVLHINGLNRDEDRPTPASSTSTAAPQPAAQPAPAPAPAPSSATPFEIPPSAIPAEPKHAVVASKGRNAKKKPAAAPAPAIVPGQMAIDSTPQGAQVQIDGKTDPTWVTPFTLSGMSAGQHSITVSKAGYASDTRTVDVVSASKSFVVTRLNLLTATLAVASTPAGAGIVIDGKDTGKLTPAQIPVGQGQHAVLVRKSGYVDESTIAEFVLGQTISFSPTLRALGNVDNIRTTGRMQKLFGGKGTQGMGTLSIKTQPKGAQVAINQHMLDKTSPVEVVLDPGNYIVDITMTGFAPIHKVISVDKGGKAVIDEVMTRQ